MKAVGKNAETAQTVFLQKLGSFSDLLDASTLTQVTES